MPVLEEAKAMVYNHNMITMAMVIFKTYKINGGQGRGKIIDQNARLFLFYRVFYLSSRYYELGSTLRTESDHSCAIVLFLVLTHCKQGSHPSHAGHQ